jgi:hypothetical protein
MRSELERVLTAGNVELIIYQSFFADTTSKDVTFNKLWDTCSSPRNSGHVENSGQPKKSDTRNDLPVTQNRKANRTIAQ